MSVVTAIRQRHRGGRGAVLTLADQLVSSVSNFALGVLIARAGGADALGTFGIAFLVWVAVMGANRALVAEPMTVAGSTEDSDAQLGEGLSATLVMRLGTVRTPPPAVSRGQPELMTRGCEHQEQKRGGTS
jgi:arginine exporter protein ArgO